MNSKKIIGIIGTPMLDDGIFSSIGIYDDFRKMIIKNNAIPYVILPPKDIDYFNTKTVDIPNLSEDEINYLHNIVDNCNAIIMQGGNRWYNYEIEILKYAIEKDKPVLGICLGMQLLSFIDNNLYCLEKNKTVINHKQRDEKYVHKVNIKENTKLRNIIKKETIEVNSSHNYHVSKVNKFIVSAYSEDGLIEAIELPNKKFVVGIQWHPEKMIDYDDNANTLIKEFINIS